MKRLLVIPLVLFLACEDNINNYKIDASFRYPSDEGSYWEYSCMQGTDSLNAHESTSFIKIINNNSAPDSCGDNVISLFNTSSLADSSWMIDISDDYGNFPSLPPLSDTLFYSHSEERFCHLETK